ncbi:hypothetical protein RRG08_048238 [Elysia crispata]|uniref:Uncharacterized protein n=1 Tax=Elysia crispata TaxID=231223 RepID=A0AAE1DBI9_9GAST|nr:hypothetical protein RRG08_048238 [Elysia crispata]
MTDYALAQVRQISDLFTYNFETKNYEFNKKRLKAVLKTIVYKGLNGGSVFRSPEGPWISPGTSNEYTTGIEETLQQVPELQGIHFLQEIIVNTQIGGKPGIFLPNSGQPFDTTTLSKKQQEQADKLKEWPAIIKGLQQKFDEIGEGKAKGRNKKRQN